MTKHLLVGAALILAFGPPAAAQQLVLQIQDGRVTLEATDVPARQILDEWAKVGGTKVVGADKIVGGPLTLKLDRMPERQALDIILSSVAGFMAAERQPSAVAGASAYDRILILATTSAPAPPPPSVAGRGETGRVPGMEGLQRRIPPRPPNMDSPGDDEVREAEEQANTANAPVFTFPAPQGSPNSTNPVFVPMTGGNPPVFGSVQPGAPAPVITLQQNANGQPTVYNFVPGADGVVPQTAPSTGFAIVGSPTPGMVQQPPAAPAPPGQPVPPRPPPR